MNEFSNRKKRLRKADRYNTNKRELKLVTTLTKQTYWGYMVK